VPILLVNPVCNLKDCPPFKFENRADLTADQLTQFTNCWSAAKACEGEKISRAVQLLDQAIAIDDQHAAVHYHLAKCYQALGNTDKAKEEFVLAKEHDICPLRILEPLREIIQDIGRATRTGVIDAQKLFEEQPAGAIAGQEWLMDHVHPTIEGHQLIADALFNEMVRQQFVVPQPHWQTNRARSYREHLESLDELYFDKRKDRLDALRRWSEGREQKVRAAVRP
jgi:tetratricopeptide (TPR) repeat protein